MRQLFTVKDSINLITCLTPFFNEKIFWTFLKSQVKPKSTRNVKKIALTSSSESDPIRKNRVTRPDAERYSQSRSNYGI